MGLQWGSGLIFALVLTLATLTALNIHEVTHLVQSDQLCSTQGMSWTPIPPDIKHTWKLFPQLDLFAKSKYFDKPIHTADQNWKELLPDSPIAIPRSRLGDLGVESDEPYVHLPRDESQVLAIPEVFVQLECVNLLRQHIEHAKDNSSYTKNPAFRGSEDEVMHRAYLCIERLREAFMCWADLGSILQPIETPEGDPQPRSGIDLATRHKCRDFDSVKRWTKENAIKAVKMDDMWWGGRLFY